MTPTLPEHPTASVTANLISHPLHFNPKFLMVYFTVHISHNEIVNLQQHLSNQTYCLMQVDPSTDCFYGVVLERNYHTLLHALAAETLEMLEYMNESEFRQVCKDSAAFQLFGNKELIEGL
jgi:hypothetical protein